MRLRPHLLVLLPLLWAAGCRGGITHEKAYTLEPTSAQATTIDPPSRDQKVTVKVTSDVPVSVYVAASKDLPGDINKINETLLAGKKLTALAAEEKMTDKTLEASVPAKTEFQVVVYNPGLKSANVKVKVEGK
jgi:hypothetical protein